MLYDNLALILNGSFSCYLSQLYISVFPYIFESLSKYEVVSQLRVVLCKIITDLCSLCSCLRRASTKIAGSVQITLCTLISINLFQGFFVYDRFFFLSRLQTRFWHLSIFILSVKNSRLLCAFCISLGLFNINLKGVSFVAVFCMTLYEVYMEVKIILSPFKPIYEQLLWLHSSISVVNSLLGS